MNNNLEQCFQLHIQKTIANLEKNHINGYYAKTKSEAILIIEKLLKEGETVAFGGSETLKQIGLFYFLEQGNFKVLDRNNPKLSKEEVADVNRQALLSDTYFASANAVTEHGEIYEVDGNGNRVAAITFGPKQVILIVGRNKIVPNVRAAIERVKNIACPANTIRLNIPTVCHDTGHCLNGGRCDEHNLMAVNAGACENSICSFSSVIGTQRNHGRIKVIIIDENLGF